MFIVFYLILGIRRDNGSRPMRSLGLGFYVDLVRGLQTYGHGTSILQTIATSPVTDTNNNAISEPTHCLTDYRAFFGTLIIVLFLYF